MFLFISTRLPGRFAPSLGAACKTVLLASLTTVGICLLANNALCGIGVFGNTVYLILLALVGFLVHAAFVARYIRDPRTGQIGFPRTLLFTFGAQALIGVSIMAVYFGVALLRR